MKTLSKLFTIGLLGSLSLTPGARANLEVAASVNIHAEADFYAPLSSRGAWIEVGSYGRCWHPAGVEVGWRPYCSGHWVWTDCGWYWESDEPWAWACYHYGWWIYDPAYAWVWVPGIEWGPAWVSWRVGGGYVGWAPLPPKRITVAGPQFVFVETTRFHEPIRPSAVIVNNTTIINKTTVTGGIKRETRSVGNSAPRPVVINEGPGIDVVQKATGNKVKSVPIQEAALRTPIPPAVSRGAGEVKGKDKTPVAPSETDKQHEPAKEGLAPSPEQRPAAPTGPPARSPQSPGGGGEAKGHGKPAEGHGKDKP